MLGTYCLLPQEEEQWPGRRNCCLCEGRESSCLGGISLGRTASFTGRKKSSCLGDTACFPRRKSSGLGRTATFPSRKESSCLGGVGLGRNAIFPGGKVSACLPACLPLDCYLLWERFLYCYKTKLYFLPFVN